MKHLIAIGLLLAAGAAYAACTTYTYYVDGKIVTCNECCYAGNCTVTCW